jgi:hypothetical protein
MFSHLWRKSYRLSSLLATIPSIFYGCFYILLIPLFATIYFLYDGDFYHTTIQYERVLDTESDKLLSELHQAFIESFRSVHESDHAVIDGWVMNVGSVSFYSLGITKDTVSFGMVGRFFSDERFPREVLVSRRLTIPLRTSISRVDPGTGEMRDCRWIAIEDDSIGVLAGRKPLPLRQLFVSPLTNGIGPLTRVLCNRRDVSTQLLGLANAKSGFPGELRGSFSRMLYLSAVTITTLGYGDILPRTNRARLLVALEAVLGIIVIGLFLNSLARERDVPVRQSDAGFDVKGVPLAESAAENGGGAPLGDR